MRSQKLWKRLSQVQRGAKQIKKCNSKKKEKRQYHRRHHHLHLQPPWGRILQH